MRRLGSVICVLSLLPLTAFVHARRAAPPPIPTAPEAPTHWALIVGISDYIHFEDQEGGDLPGAERDARGFRDVLVSRWGFPEANVRMLLNRDATRSAIEEGITGWLAANVQPGDNVVFFFAGHGAQVWDENGDEEDGLDETIAPADVDPTSPEFDILDDELGTWLRSLPSRNVVYVHDNCNAATGTRAATPFARARLLGRDVTALARPAGSAARRALPGAEDASGFDLEDVEVLELAAAQPEQAAVDAYFPGEGGAEPFHGGAFSTYLIQQLWRAPADATYAEVFRTVADALKQNRFQQDPHLSEEVTLRNAPLFFVEGRAPGSAEARVPVTAVDGGAVEVGAGSALGLTPGSVVETEGGARVLLESVSRDRARGRTLSGRATQGEKATPVAYRFPEPTLRVNVGGVDTESVAALRRALQGAAGVSLVEDEDEFSHILLRRRGTELRIFGQDGFARSERPFPVGAAGAEDVALHVLKEAAAMRLAAMENIGQTFKVGLSMVGGASHGVGETITFEASSERDGYLTLVDLGTDGTVTVLFPNRFDQGNRIRAGQTLRFPTDAMGFEITAEEPAGRGTARVFVTAEPLDIPLEEDFFQGRADAAELIGRTLADVAGGAEESPGAVRLDTWATNTLVYQITN